ncbi:Non-ribosomal peptide synthetase [Aspergillus nanangensis]|uniref:Non-ribosomal peptide synthetase n=1 Tax=Aspergillus nanangensis TaxID=2582783 RepID=A0AAD4H005_ASPNN|nr:Non-ribosomal peptide synthetase [Aspergillus nanangensis]
MKRNSLVQSHVGVSTSTAVCRMGSIQDVSAPDHVASVNPSGAGDKTSNDIRSFHIVGLTSIDDHIVLLSWLIVLLRTREDAQVNFEWAYRRPDISEPLRNALSMTDVMPGLQSNVREVAGAIAGHIPAVEAAIPLLLSTSGLSRPSTEENILHLQTSFSNNHLHIRPVYHSKTMLPFTITRHIETLANTIQTCISNPDASIEACLHPTTHDMDEIWRWNHTVPPTYNLCMHDVISTRAHNSPNAVGISSWDGELTYLQIDEYSTSVAHSLLNLGVQLHDVIPVCFEKSKWTIVAVLAVMKTGATFVLMDPALPVARLQNMREQVGAKVMVTSRGQHCLATEVLPGGKYLVVEADTFANVADLTHLAKLPVVPPEALMYIIFTSGSTGTPKGVQISHATYTSSAFPRAETVGYTETSRVLDFASYAFDVSIDSMLLTLSQGGCLCIPSDSDRLNDINGVIRTMAINYAGLTPSVARILEPDVISSLSALGLGGEAVSARDVALWGQDTRIVIGYGPCECTIGCTVNGDAAMGRDYISIGGGNGAVMWIVNPNDHDDLMPVGAVGELLVEGPIVGQGYLNDAEKTAKAFINDPPWLVKGHKTYPGRRGRLYKTGDLGRYDPDGSGGIVFVGRKDTQVKLRGQRVELGEIEAQVKARLPAGANVIAEIIAPTGAGGQSTLVAFVATHSTKGHEDTDVMAIQLSAELQATMAEADKGVKEVLPRYMVPTAYIPVNYIPVLISGKTDRRRLRQFGATVDLRSIDEDPTGSAGRELNEIEECLRQIWAQTLKLDAAAIRLNDNFFALGGNSVTAMRLVSVCKAQSLDLSVASIFANPSLSAMADMTKACQLQEQASVPTFSMISQAVESACREAAQACQLPPAAIEDIYPCTPTQESLFTFSLKSKELYVAQRVAQIPSHIHLDAWKAAWEEVVAAIPMLRTRVVQLQEPGLQQVVLKQNIAWTNATDLAQYLQTDRKERMNLGESLARYAIITEPNSNNTRYMVWTIHHVLYDGWSEPIILKNVSDILQSHSIKPTTQMRDFVRWTRNTDDLAMREFWQRGLKGAVGPQFPRLPSRDYLPTPNGMVEQFIPVATSAGWPFTMATLIRGAWALVASQYTGNDDIVFGETLVGRDIALPGVEGIIGPLIATIPIRIRVHRTSSIESYLQTVQQAVSARVPYQHMGMQNIRKVSPDAQHACEAPMGLVIQPEPEYVGSELGFAVGDVVHEALHFNPYPLMLGCGIRKGGFRVCASFDTSLIGVEHMERVLLQLQTACSQLTKGLDRTLNEISCLSEAELDQLWKWNEAPPLSWDESSRTLRADTHAQQGSVYPRAVVPWVCDPRNPSLLSPIDCVGELWLEGSFLPGQVVKTPSWLAAGSSACAGRAGNVQPTGDLVKLQHDGSLLFVSRKENVVGVQGHAVDIADIEAQLNGHLPQSIRAAAAVYQPTADSQELIVFVEHQSAEKDVVELISASHDVPCNSSGVTISATISVSLATELKRLDKFVRDSLPSYMIPYAYVVLDKSVPELEQADHTSVINQLASRIPVELVNELRDSLQKIWSNTSAQTTLTPAESILRSSWASILRIPEDKIEVDDNFFRLGGDSVLAMNLVSLLREQGHRLTVADIFQHMRLGDAAKAMKLDKVKKVKAQPRLPFSTLGCADVDAFISEVVRPQLADQHWTIRDIFPVTASQALDIRATVQTPRTSIQYTMMYFTGEIDRTKLLAACSELIKTHEILRTVFIAHGSTFLQVVLNELPTPVTLHQTDGDLETYITDLCTADIELPIHIGSSFLKLFYVQATSGQQCLILGLSHALYDGVSLPMLIRDLDALYTGSSPMPQSAPFSSYMSYIADPIVQSPAIAYWRTLLHDSSLSVLPGTTAQPNDKAIFQTKQLSVVQPPPEITTATLLTAAWALLLCRRLRTNDVTFGSVTSGRAIDLPAVETVQGPCYQLTPVRVQVQSAWKAGDLLGYVQAQGAQSAAYDFLGFEAIAEQCTEWGGEEKGGRLFDSLVHHQDWEDVDSLPFAGGTCNVDISNPHGDAACPFKAVSFSKEGLLHVGVVGSERDVVLVDSVLEELAATVEELVTRPESVLLESW